MATQADVRRIALSFPDTEEVQGRFAFGVNVKGTVKGFAWVWNERVEPKKPRVPNNKVLAVRVPTLVDKDILISADPRKFFTEPHYNGYPAVLVRLPEIRASELRELMRDGWESLVPASMRAGSRQSGQATRRKKSSGKSR
jgi:hypothetical protein